MCQILTLERTCLLHKCVNHPQHDMNKMKLRARKNEMPNECKHLPSAYQVTPLSGLDHRPRNGPDTATPATTCCLADNKMVLSPERTRPVGSKPYGRYVAKETLTEGHKMIVLVAVLWLAEFAAKVALVVLVPLVTLAVELDNETTTTIMDWEELAELKGGHKKRGTASKCDITGG